MKITEDSCRAEAIYYLGNDIAFNLKLSDNTICNRTKLEDDLIDIMNDIKNNPRYSGLEDLDYYQEQLYHFYQDLAKEQYLIDGYSND